MDAAMVENSPGLYPWADLNLVVFHYVEEI